MHWYLNGRLRRGELNNVPGGRSIWIFFFTQYVCVLRALHATCRKMKIWKLALLWKQMTEFLRLSKLLHKTLSQIRYKSKSSLFFKKKRRKIATSMMDISINCLQAMNNETYFLHQILIPSIIRLSFKRNKKKYSWTFLQNYDMILL